MAVNSNRSFPSHSTSSSHSRKPSLRARFARFVLWMTILIVIGHTFNQCIGRHYGIYMVPRGGSAEHMAEYYRQ